MSNTQTPNAFALNDNSLNQSPSEEVTSAIAGVGLLSENSDNTELADEQLNAVAGETVLNFV